MEASGECLLDTAAGLEIDLGLVLVTALGGNNDNTAGSCGTVESGSGSVLKDGEGFDVVGVEATAGNTVHNEQRTCACGDGTCTADADVGAGTRLAGRVHYHHAGHLTLEHVTYVGGSNVVQFLFTQGNYGAGKFCPLLGGITQNDHFVQQLGVRMEADIDDGAAVHGFLYLVVAETGEHDLGAHGSGDDIFAIVIRYGATAAGEEHSCADNGLAVRSVQNLSGDGDVLGGHRDRQCKRSKHGQDASW